MPTTVIRKWIETNKNFIKGINMSKTKLTAEQFTAEYPVGTKVIYTGDFGDEIQTKIRSEAWALGHGQVVVKMEGRSGGYEIERFRAL